MCGIAGVVARGRDPVRQIELDTFTDLLRHRGPDGSGTWISDSGRLGLSHTRLSIIDLHARAAQPMTYHGEFAIAFNGEIYNHLQLRRELMDLGFTFRTTSDTEVVLTAYRCWGSDMLPRLRGMFAMAIAIPAEHRVFLARDPFGIKPLYYTQDRNFFRFASEVSALHSFTDRTISTDALIDLLTWGNIKSPLTINASIHALEPGHYADVNTSDTSLVQWADATHVLDSPSQAGNADEAIQAIRASTIAHLESDVEVGIFLSSGVDSSTIASICAAHMDAPIRTLTVRNPDADESGAAERFAGVIGASHTTVEFSNSDLEEELNAAMLALDQPSLDGINSYFVSKAAHLAGLKVAMSGVGGDELFGGYSSFTRLPRLRRGSRICENLQRFPPLNLPAPARYGWNRSTERGQLAWLASYLRYPWGPYLVNRGVMAPHEVAGLLELPLTLVLNRIENRVGNEAYNASPNWVSNIEIAQYLEPQLLRDIDAVSMRNSIEVRTPLVDFRLYRELATLRYEDRVHGASKPLLRSAAMHQMHHIAGKKMGFTVPLQSWVRSGAAQLGDKPPPFLNEERSQSIVQEVIAGTRSWTHAWLIQVLKNMAM